MTTQMPWPLRYGQETETFRKDSRYMTGKISSQDKKLGKSIKAIRMMHNLSQREMAERVGLDKNYFSRLESGYRKFSIDVLQRVAEVLGINYALLILFSEMDDPKLKDFTALTFGHVVKESLADDQQLHSLTRTQ